MQLARIDMRINGDIKIKAEKASALLGLKSLTEYIVRLIDEDATKVIAQHESITVQKDIFESFITACDEVRTPNKALKQAAHYTKKAGIK